MKLLILTPEFEGSGGGIMTFYQALAPALQAQGVAVRVLEGSASNTAAEKSLRWRHGVQVETLELERMQRWFGKFGHLAAVPGLRRHLAAAWAMWEQTDFGQNADIVEACDWGLLFVPPAIEASRPLTVQCHGSIGQVSEHDPLAGEETQNAFTRMIERAILAGVDTVQTSSCSNAAYWQQATGREVLLQRAAWTRPTAHPATGLLNRGLVVGRVQRWKGPQVVCAALERLGQGPLQIDWVGRDTPWEQRDCSTTTYLSNSYPNVWGKRIIHHAPISAEEVSRRQSGALFNLIPSTWDVFNFTAVEAMASGRPTIVSTGAGASELIENGVDGYTFPSNDVERLAGTLERVISASLTDLAGMGRAAQETINRALDPATIASQRILAYHSTIDSFPGHRRPMPHQWLDQIVRPADCSAGADGSFLDQVPLWTLVRHIGGRLGKKMSSSLRDLGVVQ